MLETIESKLICLGIVVVLLLGCGLGGFLWGDNHGYANGYSTATDKLNAQIATSTANAASANAAVAAVKKQLADNAAAEAAQAAEAAAKVAAAQQAQAQAQTDLAAWMKKYEGTSFTPAEQACAAMPIPIGLQDY